MRKLLLVLLIICPSLAWAEEDNLVDVVPSLHLGIGVEMPSGIKETDYGMVLVKGYLLQMGESGIGAKLLGLGVKVNALGEVGLVISPTCFYVGRICAGPEFIKPAGNKTNFGMSLNYEF